MQPANPERALATFRRRYGRLPDLDDGLDQCRLVVCDQGGDEEDAQAVYDLSLGRRIEVPRPDGTVEIVEAIPGSRPVSATRRAQAQERLRRWNDG